MSGLTKKHEQHCPMLLDMYWRTKGWYNIKTLLNTFNLIWDIILVTEGRSDGKIDFSHAIWKKYKNTIKT